MSASSVYTANVPCDETLKLIRQKLNERCGEYLSEAVNKVEPNLQKLEKIDIFNRIQQTFTLHQQCYVELVRNTTINPSFTNVPKPKPKSKLKTKAESKTTDSIDTKINDENENKSDSKTTDDDDTSLIKKIDNRTLDQIKKYFSYLMILNQDNPDPAPRYSRFGYRISRARGKYGRLEYFEHRLSGEAIFSYIYGLIERNTYTFSRISIICDEFIKLIELYMQYGYYINICYYCKCVINGNNFWQKCDLFNEYLNGGDGKRNWYGHLKSIGVNDKHDSPLYNKHSSLLHWVYNQLYHIRRHCDGPSYVYLYLLFLCCKYLYGESAIEEEKESYNGNNSNNSNNSKEKRKNAKTDSNTNTNSNTNTTKHNKQQETTVANGNNNNNNNNESKMDNNEGNKVDLNVVHRKYPESFDLGLFVSKFEGILDINTVPSGDIIKQFDGSLYPYWNVYHSNDSDESLPISLITFYRDIRTIETDKDGIISTHFEYYWDLKNIRIFNFAYLKHLLKLGILPFSYSDLIEKDVEKYQDMITQQQQENQAKSLKTKPNQHEEKENIGKRLYFCLF